MLLNPVKLTFKVKYRDTAAEDLALTGYHTEVCRSQEKIKSMAKPYAKPILVLVGGPMAQKLACKDLKRNIAVGLLDTS